MPKPSSATRNNTGQDGLGDSSTGSYWAQEPSWSGHDTRDGGPVTAGDVVPTVDLSWGRSFLHGFPHDFFAWLRREHPVWWHEATEHTPGGEGFWVVSRHADAVAIMRDPVTF